ncbi:hypothetical protein DSOUD_2268 [Desulfuromonas soudanensis]|uniref:Type II toxin-antitoxin system RelE/ParE family toxin n=2 Tax=Desulfuromonas soudanensis TaxID=1603606 RepID=A0A0M4DJ32_9BACT|nr:hypothetical protein DSOUD_2268 [Desulfuromonas soudanensis]
MSCMILKTRHFNRWAKKAGLSDKALSEAVVEMVGGLIDAVLGNGIVKKRIALPGQGKRGSTRTLLATNRGDRWIFVYGFEKNQRSNISDRELEALKMLAVDLLSLSKEQIAAAIDSGALLEVLHETNKN